MMDTKQLALEILEETFPVEIQKVSEADIEDMLSGAKFQATTGGSAIEASEALLLFSTAAQLILAILQIYLLLKTDLRRKPSKVEVGAKLNEEQHIELPESVRMKLLEKTYNKLSDSDK